MALFAKKCAVCGAKLPDKRQYESLCTPCGDAYHRLKGQIEDTVAVIDRARDDVKCYDRCLFLMGLVTEFRPFVATGRASYPGGRSFEEMEKYAVEKATAFAGAVRAKNENRKYEKRIGVPHFAHWSRLYKLSSAEPGSCKACWSAPAVNEAGFCRSCLIVGTGANQDDMDAFLASGGGSGLSGEGLTLALLNWKLEKSREG